MIFADPPYFLSSNGISCSGGKMVSVNKGNWDKSISIEEKHKFNRKWIKLYLFGRYGVGTRRI